MLLWILTLRSNASRKFSNPGRNECSAGRNGCRRTLHGSAFRDIELSRLCTGLGHARDSASRIRTGPEHSKAKSAAVSMNQNAVHLQKLNDTLARAQFPILKAYIPEARQGF